MLVALIVNAGLVLLGYYLGLKKAQTDWRDLINDNGALEEAFTLHLSGAPPDEGGGVAGGDVDPLYNDPVESGPAGGYDPALKDPEEAGGRIFKFFN